MGERELIDYIQLLILQGQSVDKIKQGLLSKYSMETIDQALKKINFTSNAFSPTLNQSSAVEPTISHTLWGNPINADVKKSILIVITSFSLYSISVLYFLLTISSLGFSFALDRISFTNELVFPWLRYFPEFGQLPFIYAIATIYFFFVATKISDKSQKSFWLALFSLLCAPPLIALVSKLLISPLLSVIISKIPNTLEAKISYSLQNIGIQIFDPIFLLSLISIFLLLLTFKKYKHDPIGFSDKGRVILALLLLLIFVPVTSLVFWFYVHAASTDYGYKTIQAQVNFHVYHPNEKTNQLVPTSRYVIEPYGENANAVHITFDIPFDKISPTNNSKPVTINQERVEPDFDLDTFSKNYINNADALRQIPVLTARNKAAYSLSEQKGGKTLNYLLFVTTDNVLIILSSPDALEPDLVKFAESLR